MAPDSSAEDHIDKLAIIFAMERDVEPKMVRDYALLLIEESQNPRATHSSEVIATILTTQRAFSADWMDAKRVLMERMREAKLL